jgi:uncharacterized protein YdeI (YjbR/CyaY-like superfamily)
LNVERAEALIAARRMRPPGLAAIAAAKADGRWAAAYASQRNAGVPADLAAALKRNQLAGSRFGQLNKTDRYTPAVRLARLNKIIARLEGEIPEAHPNVGRKRSARSPRRGS